MADEPIARAEYEEYKPSRSYGLNQARTEKRM